MTGGELVVRPIGGLCNRLQAVTSFAVLARRSNRALKVFWSGGPGWSDEDLADLFDNAVPRQSPADFARAKAEALDLRKLMTVEKTYLGRSWLPADARAFAGVFDHRSHPIVVYEGFRRCQDLLAPEHRRRLLPGFEAEYVSELRRWQPVQEIRASLARLSAEFTSRTVGVHIRRGDAMHHPALSGEYRRSSDRAFMRSIDRLLRIRPGTTLFLATDSKDTQRLFAERYGDRILVNPDKRFVPSIIGAPKQNQRDAVIDLFTLARTRTILGTHTSTFSTMAATLGDAHLRIVVSDSQLTQLRRTAASGRREATRLWRSWRAG